MEMIDALLDNFLHLTVQGDTRVPTPLREPKDAPVRAPQDPRSFRQYVWSYVSRSPLRSLWNLEGIPVRVIVKNTWNAMFDDNLLGRSAELGFYFIFALFPTLVTACSILGLAARSAVTFYEHLLQYLWIVVPPSALGTVLEAFNQTTAAASSGKLTFGLVAALWSASVGFSAIQDSLNVVYRVKENRPYWRARLSAIGVTFVLSIVITLMLASLAGSRLSCPPGSPSYLSSLSGRKRRHLTEDRGMAGCHSLSFFAFRADLLFRAGRQSKPMALAHAWLRHWHAGMARGLAWASGVRSLHQQLLGYLRFSRHRHHPAHLVLSERTDAAAGRRDQQRNRGRGQGKETGRHGNIETRNCELAVRRPVASIEHRPFHPAACGSNRSPVISASHGEMAWIELVVGYLRVPAQSKVNDKRIRHQSALQGASRRVPHAAL